MPKSKGDNSFHQVYQTKFTSPVLAVCPLNAALLAGCEDGSLQTVEFKDEVMLIVTSFPNGILMKLMIWPVNWKVLQVTSSRDSSSPITALLGLATQGAFLVIILVDLGLNMNWLDPFLCLSSFLFLNTSTIWTWSDLDHLIKHQVGRKDGTLTLHTKASERSPINICSI